MPGSLLSRWSHCHQMPLETGEHDHAENPEAATQPIRQDGPQVARVGARRGLLRTALLAHRVLGDGRHAIPGSQAAA